jgi:hypothetical protein
MKELSPGFDLWVLPDRDHSDWCVGLDWYLQFQVSRIWARAPQNVPTQLLETARQAEIDPLPQVDDHNVKTQPTLIFSASLLPNQKTLHLPYHNNVKDWLRELESVWLNLKEPSVRVFLPRGVKPDHFEDANLKITKTAEFILDSNPWS